MVKFGGKVIERICLDRLVEHPCNPNVMSKAAFKKLVGHIRAGGNYEPVVVRQHPGREGYYEILNGCQRVKALALLGVETVDCVVWEVSDGEAIKLVATLNRLRGRDAALKRAELVCQLCEAFDEKEIVSGLPETKGAIEKLKRVAAGGPAAALPKCEGPEAVVFMLDKEQKEMVENAVSKAMDTVKGANAAERKAEALVRILGKKNFTTKTLRH